MAWFPRNSEERKPGEDSQAQADARIARIERIERLRRASFWYLSVMLTATLIGVMIGRVVNGQIPWGGVPPKSEAGIVSIAADARDGVLRLRLTADSPVVYRRVESHGAVSLQLAGVRLAGAAESGRVSGPGGALSWRIEPRGSDVQVLLVGLGEDLQVKARANPSSDQWALEVEAQVLPR
ncbi:hypothetical protein IB234_04950 [Pseudomonas sp. PDM16]|uniref:hypothetical protein n=1 Tax=Pseudomonas sp. PDM16 TaxID=2769292 RepID=UPI00177DFC4A|nr:hypothetical protein [Pseudomonas sp. PDM16]MBD9413906.1 hypothetical protein [Pseudomonas sp. PDM16]